MANYNYLSEEILDEEIISEELSQQFIEKNKDISKIIFKIQAPPVLIGGPGKILPCVELCNIGYNFKEQQSLNVTNLNGRLYISTDLGNKNKSTLFPCLNSINVCTESSTPAEKLYSLVDLIITVPAIHKIYVNEKETIYDGEIFMVFRNITNGVTTYKVLATLLEKTNEINIAIKNDSLNAYQFFKALGNDLPDKNTENKTKTVVDWDLNDLLPKNKWFYNYTHPNNTIVNWYVYRDPLFIPNSFKINFIRKVSQITKNNQIVSGINAYNTLYKAIGKLRNPSTNDFVIFEQRDLTRSTQFSSVQEEKKIEKLSNKKKKSIKKEEQKSEEDEYSEEEEEEEEDSEEKNDSIEKSGGGKIFGWIFLLLNIILFIYNILSFLSIRGIIAGDTIAQYHYIYIIYFIIIIIIAVIYFAIYTRNKTKLYISNIIIFTLTLLITIIILFLTHYEKIGNLLNN